MEWTKKRIIGATVGGLFVVGLIGSATDDPGSGKGGGAGSQAGSSTVAESRSPEASAGSSPAAAGSSQNEVVSEPVATPTPKLTLTMPGDRDVYRDRVTVAGRIAATDGGNTKGATVLVNGKAAPIRDGRWSKTITVDRGDNEIEVEAKKGDYDVDYGEATFTRKRSKAEIAAAIERRRAAEAARKATYMANAQILPYNQLEKNPDRHAGKRVKFTGQIFQIQEDDGSSVILLSVTDEGYGFWTDNVWVDYPGTIKGAEDDVITVYGTIEGEKSYDTQIGGSTYVPQMTAKYVVE